MNRSQDRQEALLKYLDGNLAPHEADEVREWLRTDAEARAFLRLVAEQAVSVADLERETADRTREMALRRDWEGTDGTEPRRRLATAVRVAAAAIAVIGIAVAIRALRPAPAPEIARITGISGAVRWVGGSGSVNEEPAAGDRLTGGTLETLAADAWSALRFGDGSTVTISGQSTLTIANPGQKTLHLRSGSLSAEVTPQPAGSPLLIHTPTADLEVLGTQLTVEVEPAATKLRVHEGQVQVTRLSDGAVALVPSKHEIVAAAGRGAVLSPTPRPLPVPSWDSTLPEDALCGTWVPSPTGDAGRMATTPILWKEGGKPVTLYVVSMAVSRRRPVPVVPGPGAKIRIRGRLGAPGSAFFGLTTHTPNGAFAGKFIAWRAFPVVGDSGSPFDVEFRLEDFGPASREPERSGAGFSSPAGLELMEFWCGTADSDLGMRIESVRILPADAPPPPPPPENLSEVLRVSGFDRLIGSWADAATGGAACRTDFAWRFEGKIVEVRTRTGDSESVCMMGLHAKTGDVYHFGADNEGNAVRGRWLFGESEAVLDLGTELRDGKERKIVLRLEMPDDDSLIVTPPEAEPGQPGALRMARVKDAAQP